MTAGETVVAWLGICVAAIFVAALAFLTWFRKNRPPPPDPNEPRARIAPAVIQSVIVAVTAYLVVHSVYAWVAGHGGLKSADTIWIQVLLAITVGLTSFGVYRTALGHSVEPSAFTKRRVAQMQAAMTLPPAEREAILRPIRNRGFARAAIVLAGLLSMVPLAGCLGIGAAALISLAATATLFVVLHKLYDL
jgi:hypothetical protein